MNDTSHSPPGTSRWRAIAGRVTGFAILLAAIAAVAYVVYFIDQYPRTDDAFARADTIGVAPQVSGRIIDLKVQDNQMVRKGDVLFVIDPIPYEHVLERTKSVLAAQQRQIGLTQREVNAQKFSAAASRANIGRVEAQYKQATDTLNRIEPLLAQEFVTAEQVDQARTARRSAEAALEAAQQDAHRAEAAVSGVDALAARLGELRAAVASAEYDLQHTIMRAPFDGRVVDLDISVGEFATTGRRLFTLVDTRNWYVIANFRETELKHIKPGMPAEVYLMIDTAQRFHGTVHSIGWGVLPDEGTSSAGLPKVPRAINWVRVAQRFPVRIRVDDPQPDLFRIGASAVAVIPRARQEGATTAARPSQ
jgi:multidrug efflux system membrane fusion protein